MLKRTINLALLASVAMVSTAFAEVASSGPSLPTLSINGNTVMNAYYAHNSKNTDESRNVHLSNDVSDLYFTIKGRMSNGIEYGYKMGLQSFAAGSPVFQQNFIEFNGKFGTVQIGNVVGVEDSMIADASSIGGGMGTFDGGYHNVVNMPAFVMRGNDNIGDTGYATKIVYYTPTYYNFQFGVTYTPNTAHRGDAGMDKATLNGNTNAPGNRNFLPNKKLYPYDLDSFAFGLSYKKELNNWGINLNGAYITGDSYYPAITDDVGTTPAKRTKAHRTNAYQLGAVVGYRRQNGHLVQVAGGWLDNGKSRLQKDNTSIYLNNPDLGRYVNVGTNVPDAITFGNLYQGNSGKAWNVGTAYVMGVYKFAATFQQTERKTDATNRARTSVASLTADVVPVGGLKFYVEADYVHARSNDTARATAASLAGLGSDAARRTGQNQIQGNDAFVLALGTKVSF
jgi:hypothetical protein